MKYLATENLPFESFKILLTEDWDIIHVGETNVGIADEEVIGLSYQPDYYQI